MALIPSLGEFRGSHTGSFHAAADVARQPPDQDPSYLLQPFQNLSAMSSLKPEYEVFEKLSSSTTLVAKERISDLLS